MSKAKDDIWHCKIGSTKRPLPHGADLPMRIAVAVAYEKLTGIQPDFVFSGWGGSLSDAEKEALKK